MAKIIERGTCVAFLSPQHSWVLGNVVSYDPSTRTYSCTATDPEQIRCDRIKAPDEIWAPRLEFLEEDVNDLLQLTELHEASLLFCLKRRYMRDIVYTNIGPIVVALNPFNFKIPWYMDTMMPEYLSEGVQIERNLPHSWAVAHNTYWEMRENSQNQTILISGESGAGKTEGAKIVMKYLGALSTLHGTDMQRDACAVVNDKIIASSPILESFGNAKTARNDNSSRFGKFMKIQFDRDGFLVGSYATKYLLEKSRIITAGPGERIFHSFYQAACGEDKGKYGLRSVKLYRVLNSGECLQIPGLDDGETYNETKSAFKKVGISEEDQTSIWRMVAGILFFQNLDFVETEQRSGMVASIDESFSGIITRVAEQWEIPEKDLERELLTTTTVTRGEATVRYHNKAVATDVRDTVSKSIYDWMFEWLVNKINAQIDQSANTTHWIGLLDIFGFEDFERNSFEQLCINLANEALQVHYSQHIFTEDMKECREEGIDTSAVTFCDTRPCVELLIGKVSVFTLLDEECLAPGGNERNYIQKINANFQGTRDKPGHPFYATVTGKLKDTTFKIRHYAADVVYAVEGFLEKNKETLKDAMKIVLSKSNLKLLVSIVPPIEDSVRPKEKITVGGGFAKSLTELLNVINITNPHWIRCIKPHRSREPRRFSHPEVCVQLRSAGVLDTVKVRKAGYPIRFKKALFMVRYKVLLRKETDSEDPTEACRDVFKRLGITAAIGQLGKTKLFLRQEAFTKLNHAKDEAMAEYALFLQGVGRANFARGELFKMYVEMHRARIMAERKAREEALRRRREAEERRRQEEELERLRLEMLEQQRRAASATVIQKYIRGHLTRYEFYRYFLEQRRAEVERGCELEFQRYRETWMDADRHLKLFERRLNERIQREQQHETIEDYVRMQRPEVLKEQHEAHAKRIEEKNRQKKKIDERDKQDILLRTRAAIAKRRRALVEQATAEEAKIKKERGHLLEAEEKLRVDRLQERLQRQAREEQEAARAAAIEQKFMASLRNKVHRSTDPVPFHRAIQLWKDRETWEACREERFVADEQQRIAQHRREATVSKLLQGGSISYPHTPTFVARAPSSPMTSPITGHPTSLTAKELALEMDFASRKLQQQDREAQCLKLLSERRSQHLRDKANIQ